MEKSVFTHEYALFLRQLRETRIAAGLSQAEVGKRLGQTQSWISKCERGERRLDLVEVRAFCGAMGVGWVEFVQRLDARMEGGTGSNAEAVE